MKLLEKLRARPEWKDEDAAVRAAAVRSMAAQGDAQELLVQIARQDDDPSVRREAVRWIENVDDVLSVRRSDPDETVRTVASEALRTHALEAVDDLDVEAVLASLSARDLALVSRSARSDHVSLAAVAMLTDDKWLGAVARGAHRIEIAKAALGRMRDPAELLSVVLKSEDKTVALLAFEKLSDDLSHETLGVISKRARQKAVARRARVLLAEQHAEQSGRQSPVTVGPGDHPGAVPPIVETRPPDFAIEHAAFQKKTEQRKAASAACRRLCQQVDGLDGAGASAQLLQLRDEWVTLCAVGAEDASSTQMTDLSDRFEASVFRYEQRCRRWTADQDQLERLETLTTKLEKLATHDGTDQVERMSPAEESWRETMAMFRGRSLDSETETRLATFRQRKDVVHQRQRERRAASLSERERQRQDNLERLETLCDAMERVVGTDALERQVAERHLRSVRRVLDDLESKRASVSLPSRRAREVVGRRLRHAHTLLLGRVRELRDFEDWQRWANLGVQESLCAQLEALPALSDDSELTTRYREIMNQWRQAADLPKGRGEDLRQRFQTAHDLVYPRCQAYLAAQAEDRDRNLSRRHALVEEAERLASSTHWLATVKRFAELQAQWKEIGPVPRRHQRETWSRFRAACNTFFTRRKEDLAKRKEEWSGNFERKQELSTRVEALGEAPDIAAALAQVREAQGEWKTIGPVRRKQTDAVWQRFRAACDVVFVRAQEVEQKAAAEKVAVRETLCDELSALLPPGDRSGGPPEHLAEIVRDIQQRWRQAPDVPQVLRRTLAARFGQTIARVVEAYPDGFRGTELDPSRHLKRFEAICQRVETLAQREVTVDAEVSPVEILATKWRDALASNLMGARVDETARRRGAIEEVKQLQAERRRLGQLPGEEAQVLAQRFQRACDRLFEACRTAQGDSR